MNENELISRPTRESLLGKISDGSKKWDSQHLKDMIACASSAVPGAGPLPF